MGGGQWVVVGAGIPHNAAHDGGTRVAGDTQTLSDLPRKPSLCQTDRASCFYRRRAFPPRTQRAWVDHEETTMGYEIPFNRFSDMMNAGLTA